MSIKLFTNTDNIFKISNDLEFEKLAIEVFNFQYLNNQVYRQYCELIKVDPKSVETIQNIPFLPISFFKTHQVTVNNKEDVVFTSSGTTGTITSKHHVFDLKLYEESFIKGFENTYGNIKEYTILGLLPSYLEREGSSLIYMVDKLIKLSGNSKSGFYLNNYEDLLNVIKDDKSDKKTLIIGVSYALLDLAEKYKQDLSNCIVIETGGMKGKRKEIPKLELHNILQNGFNLNHIHSEYGMTELLSQAYSIENQRFTFPKWMKAIIREANDPLSISSSKKTGGINIIDLANIYSCSFIATQDLGKVTDNQLEILGRFDNSDIRGCNLLIQ
jgi:phenylacetate-coenzyme A ligase PaaK-like adenylate-forming protein